MKILFLSTWFPYPLDTGSRIRMNYLLKALTERHEVDFIAFKHGPECDAFLPTLEKWCNRVGVVNRDPFWVDTRKNLQGFLSSKPKDVISGHSPEMAALVNEFASGETYDLVIASVETIAPYALAVKKTPRILEEHNYMSSWTNDRFGKEKLLPKKIRYWLSLQKIQRYERWLYPQFSRCSMVSEQNRQELERVVPAMCGRVTIIPNGVDTERNYIGLAQPIPKSLIYNGPLTYLANLDAMVYFTREILPQIHTEEPDVSLKITGRYNRAVPTRLPRDPRIQLTGFLEDIRLEVARSWICVVPLRDGSGSRLKILEAMALGTPVVSTSKGAEGLEVTDGREILIADTPGEFAHQTLRLLGDVELRNKLVKNARELVEKKYSWEGISELFCNWVESRPGL